MFNGINKITLFNGENDIIAFKKIYFVKNKIIDLDIIKVEETLDSLKLNLQFLNHFTKGNTSISILPNKFENYYIKNNILLNYLISPYIDVSDKEITYFQNEKMSKETIDLIINTSSINFIKKRHFIKGISPFEVGISIKGKVNADLDIKNGKEYQVLITSKENSLIYSVPLQKRRVFKFKNLKFKYPSSYQLSLLDDKGNVVPSVFYIYKNDDFKRNKESLTTTTTTATTGIYNVSNFELDNDYTELDEIEIKGKRKKELIHLPTSLSGGFLKVHKVYDNMLTSSNSVADIVHSIPGIIFTTPDGFVASEGKKVKFKGRGPNTFLGNTDALVILNGVVLASHEVLEDINASEIDGEIEVNKSGAGYGIRGSNGVLIIKLKKIINLDRNRIKSTIVKSHNTDFGFKEASHSYQKSLLNYIDEESKEFYETFNWIPNFNILPNTNNLLKIKKPKNRGVKLVINGITSEGKLIFREIDFSGKINNNSYE